MAARVMNMIELACVAWAGVELAFLAIVVFYIGPRMNRLETPAKYPIEGKRLIYKILETVDWLSDQEDSACSLSTFLEGWFRGTPCSELRRENVIAFLAWAMYAKETSAISKGERKNVLELVKVMEERLGRTLEPGYNPEARCIRHTLEPVVPFSHRPLAVYLILSAIRAIIRGHLYVCGFRRSLAPCGKFHYWFRRYRCLDQPAKETGSLHGRKSGGNSPVVFFHGVGSGLPWYALAIWRVCRGKTSIIIESPSIMMNLHLLRGHTPPTETELVESVESIMAKHRLKSATFFGHSFGSIAVSWMARRRPHLVSQIALLDPVCLLLFLPDVARSFLYPDQTKMALIERVMLFLITKEKGISHTLRRHFWWYANVLWPEDIQCPMVVGLAGMDKIVPAKPLRRFLLSHPSFLPGAAGSTHDANGNTLCNGQSNGMSTSKSSGQPTGATPRRGSRRRSVGDMHRNEARKQLPPSCVQEDCTSNRRSTKISSSDGSKSGNEQPQMDQRTDDLAYSKASHLDKGVRHAKTVAVAATNGADGSVNSVDGGLINCVGQAVAKRVELVYWSELGHGWALGDVRRLDEFVEVLRRQDECFVDR